MKWPRSLTGSAGRCGPSSASFRKPDKNCTPCWGRSDMASHPPEASREDLGYFIDAFETAWRRCGNADLGAFLPPAEHPLYQKVLCELIRVDLEHAWRGGRPHRLEAYRETFPA